MEKCHRHLLEMHCLSSSEYLNLFMQSAEILEGGQNFKKKNKNKESKSICFIFGGSFRAGQM